MKHHRISDPKKMPPYLDLKQIGPGEQEYGLDWAPLTLRTNWCMKCQKDREHRAGKCLDCFSRELAVAVQFDYLDFCFKPTLPRGFMKIDLTD